VLKSRMLVLSIMDHTQVLTVLVGARGVLLSAPCHTGNINSGYTRLSDHSLQVLVEPSSFSVITTRGTGLLHRRTPLT